MLEFIYANYSTGVVIVVCGILLYTMWWLISSIKTLTKENAKLVANNVVINEALLGKKKSTRRTVKVAVDVKSDILETSEEEWLRKHMGMDVSCLCSFADISSEGVFADAIEELMREAVSSLIINYGSRGNAIGSKHISFKQIKKKLIGGVIFVKTGNGGILPVAICAASGNNVILPRHVEIKMLYVAPAFRGKGYANMLLSSFTQTDSYSINLPREQSEIYGAIYG